MNDFTRRTFLKAGACLTAGFVPESDGLFASGTHELSLPERMMPAPVKGGFAMDDCWVWNLK